MKKALKRTMAIFLASLMILSSFAVMALAVEPNEVATVLEPGTVPVTISPKTDSALFVFTPTQTSYYYFSTNSTDYVWLDICDESDKFYKFGTCELVVYLQAAEKYIISVSSDGPKSFNLTLKDLGRITNLKIEDEPYQECYVDGYDMQKDCEQPSPAGFLDFYGLKINITFSDGTYMINAYDDYQFDYDLFDIDLNDDYELGKNVVTLTSVCGAASDSYDIYIIANPIESIEITKMPEKTDYVTGLDGNFGVYTSFDPDAVDIRFQYDFCFDGLEVKINFTDGTSKTAVYSDGSFLIDGKEATYYCAEYDITISIGDLFYNCTESEFFVYFLGYEAHGEFNLVRPTGFNIIKVIYRALIVTVVSFFQTIWDYIYNVKLSH